MMTLTRTKLQQGGDLLKCSASTLSLKDDPQLIQQYISHHRNMSQEQLDGMKRNGINRLKIFLRGQRMFMFVETTDDYQKRIKNVNN